MMFPLHMGPVKMQSAFGSPHVCGSGEGAMLCSGQGEISDERCSTVDLFSYCLLSPLYTLRTWSLMVTFRPSGKDCCFSIDSR